MKKTRIAVCTSSDANITAFTNIFDVLGAECRLLSSAPEDVSGFDGLLLPGGVDVEPWRYGEENVASNVAPELDALQFATLDAFVQSGKPVLGICRGHQLINVYFGGSLIQHLPNAEKHMRNNGVDNVHEIRVLPECFLTGFYGASPTVNSSHHQAVKEPGRGLEIGAYDASGVPEAIYHKTLPVYGVQFHPERMCLSYTREDTVNGMPIFEFFLRRCSEQSRK